MSRAFEPSPARYHQRRNRKGSLTYAKVRLYGGVRIAKATPQSTRPPAGVGYLTDFGVRSVHRDAEYHLSWPELDRLIRGASNMRDRALIILFVDTGIRRFEAAQLLCGDLDIAQGLLIVRRGKGNKLRMLPISERLKIELQRVISTSPDKPLFRTTADGALSTRQINRIIAFAGWRAGIHNPNPRQRNVTCHLLRHSFARHWKDAGGNIETLARILGHSSVKTTWDLYGSLSIEDIKRHYQKLINAKKRREDV